MGIRVVASRNVHWLALLAAASVAMGCGDSKCGPGLTRVGDRCLVIDPPEPDSGTPDAGGNDAGSDAGFDAGLDAGTDAGLDAGSDAGVDAGSDAGSDGGTFHDAFVPEPDGGSDGGPGILACDLAHPTHAPCTCEGSPSDACNARNAQLLTLEPCCDTHQDDSCGVIMPALTGPLAGCHAEHQPGNVSQSCGAMLDAVEGDPPPPGAPNNHTNGLLDVPLSVGLVQLSPCCTPEGVCGVQEDGLDIVATHNDHSTTTHVGTVFGCVPLTDLALPDGSLGNAAVQSFAPSPFCVPNRKTDDAACPPKLTIDGKSLCDTLPKSAIGCDASADTPAWVCVSHLSADGKSLAPLREIGSGELPKVGACMEYLPTSVHGCGEGKLSDGNCIANVPEGISGCVDPH